MDRRQSTLRIVVLFVLMAWAAPAAAATLIVDAGGGTPYQTIQSAIDAAIAGVDDVLVRCGTYTENVVMRDGVTVSGEGAQCTIIDGNQNGSVVSFVAVGAGTTLQGFTISNGLSDLGGGIYVENGSPTITRNVIVGNHASGGLGSGGGLFIADLARDARVTTPVISGNLILGNVAQSYGGGMEISDEAEPTVSNNVFEGNTAGVVGGAIDIFTNSEVKLVNNTIVRNCLQTGGNACTGGGGAIAADLGASVQMNNNVIAWNEAAAGAGGAESYDAIWSLNNNDAFGNVPANYSVPGGDPTGTNGNISADPLFVDEKGSFAGFQPRSDSPLVDGGISTMAPPDDIRLIPRPLDGDGNATTRYDIGARENEGVTRLRFDSAGAVAWDASVNGSALFNLYRGDLATLRATGIYTQDIATVVGAARTCGLATPAHTDLDTPDPDQVYFYLAVLEETSEGGLGFDGTPAMRAFTDPNRCP